MPQVIVREGKAQLVNPAGGTVEVPVEEASALLQQGYSAQSAEQYNENFTRRERSGLGQKALTLGEGALEGATLGLGTAVAAELGGDEYRQAALERRAVNPGSHVAGQVAGAVLPTLAAGGGSLGARALAGVGAPARLANAGGLAAGEGAAALLGASGGALKEAARTALKYGTAGAVEGAAFGLGTSLADSALENTDWTADRALAGMRDGALFGLAGGAVAGGVGSLASSGGRKLLDAMLEGKTLKQAARDYADGRTVRAVVDRDQKVWNRLTRNGTDPDHIEEVAEEIRKRGIDRLPDAEKGPAIQAVKKEFAEQLDAVITRLDWRPPPESILPGAPDLPEVIRPNIKGLREELQTKVLDPLRSTGSGTDARIARAVDRELKGFFEKADSGKEITFADLRKFKQGIGKAHSDALTKPATAREMDKVYAIVSKHIDDAASTASPEIAETWRKANRGYGDFDALAKGHSKKTAKDVSGRFNGFEDRLAGYETGIAAALLTGNPAVGFFTRMIATPAHRLLQDRGNAALGRIASWVAEYEGRITNAAQVAARLKPLSTLPATVTSRAGLVKERNENFERIQKKLDDMEQNPQLMAAEIQRVIGPIAGEQPEVAMKMATRMQEDYAWLRSKLPAPVGNNKFASLTPHLEKPGVVSGRDKARVVAYAQALADPASVLEDAARGKINWDGITALKERRPEQWEAVRAAVMTATAQAKETLPYRTAILYGVAFDFNSNPAFLQIPALQSAFVPLPAPQPGPSSNPDTSVNETETPYQKAIGE